MPLLLLLLVVDVRLILGVAIVTASAVNIVVVVVSAVAAIIFNDGRLGSTFVVGISVMVIVFDNLWSVQYDSSA